MENGQYATATNVLRTPFERVPTPDSLIHSEIIHPAGVQPGTQGIWEITAGLLPLAYRLVRDRETTRTLARRGRLELPGLHVLYACFGQSC